MTRINIIIPCYNQAQYVAETIRSVKAQTSNDWECVIVDDGSYDGSGEIIDKETEGDPRFHVVHTWNRGVAAARNLGIWLTEGGYILPLDADDKLAPEAVSRFIEGWEKNPDASLLVPMIRKFGQGLFPVVQERMWKGYEALKTQCSPTNSSCFKRSDWERVGGYSEGTMYEDWEFWIRLLYGNDNVVNIPEVLVEYRVHGDSRWHQAVKHHERELEIMKGMNPKIFIP